MLDNQATAITQLFPLHFEDFDINLVQHVTQNCSATGLPKVQPINGSINDTLYVVKKVLTKIRCSISSTNSNIYYAIILLSISYDPTAEEFFISCFKKELFADCVCFATTTNKTKGRCSSWNARIDLRQNGLPTKSNTLHFYASFIHEIYLYSEQRSRDNKCNIKIYIFRLLKVFSFIVKYFCKIVLFQKKE